MNDSKEYLGLVTKKFNEFCYVSLIDKNILKENQNFLCTVRKSLNFKNNSIFVGDRVNIEKVDFLNSTAVIKKLINRENILSRPAVANLSDIYITCSVDEPKLSLSQVSKYLISAEKLGIRVKLLLTKCDLISLSRKIYLIDKFKKWGYSPLTLNINNNTVFDNLLKELKTKKCSIFIGPSGVGKTTLINRIVPGLNNSTAHVSRKIKRGVNTTRNVELIPLSNKSYIVDTPGFNIQNIDVNLGYIQQLFPEIKLQFNQQEKRCKFRNCLHLQEPGCVLNKDFERYIFYKELIELIKNQNHQNQAD